MEKNKMLSVVLKALDDKKAVDLQVIKVRDITVLTDYFVICTGSSTTHVKTLADEVDVKVKEELGEDPMHREGYDGGRWILLDYGEILVHVFSRDCREFYKLERLWADGEPVDVAEYIEGENK